MSHLTSGRLTSLDMRELRRSTCQLCTPALLMCVCVFTHTYMLTPLTGLKGGAAKGTWGDQRCQSNGLNLAWCVWKRARVCAHDLLKEMYRGATDTNRKCFFSSRCQPRPQPTWVINPPSALASFLKTKRPQQSPIQRSLFPVEERFPKYKYSKVHTPGGHIHPNIQICSKCPPQYIDIKNK